MCWWNVDLRMGDFFPPLLLPLNAYPELVAALAIVFISTYTLTIPLKYAALLRVAVAPVGFSLFWDFGFGDWAVPTNSAAVGMATITMYALMRLVETNFVSLLDESPPKWIRDGQVQPVPKDRWGRLAYAFDLTTSLRGTSWFPKTHWDWAPRSLVNFPTRDLSRGDYLRRAFPSLVLQVLCMDIADTLTKSRTWNPQTLTPVTSLTVPEQILFSLTVCSQTALAITIPHTVFGIVLVSIGCPPSGWPPMFNRPFSARSLADFWTKHWHAIFRRVFERLALGILSILPCSASYPLRLRRAIRGFAVFFLSASLHIILMARLDCRHPEYPRALLDPAIFKFFLAQPFGLAFEALVVLPTTNRLCPEKWRPTFSRMWAWSFMLWTGRFWADVWVHRGFWQANEKVVGYSVVRGILYGKWAVDSL